MATRKIRILYHNPPFMVGGAEKTLLYLLKHLDRKRFDPILVSYERSPMFPFVRKLGVPTKIMRSATAEDRRRFARWIQKNSIDIIESTHYYPMIGVTAATANVPYVWRSGSHIDVACADQPKRDRRAFLKAMVGLSARVVCMSNYIGEQFEGVHSSKIVKIFPGIDLDAIDEGKRTPAIRDGSPRLGMVAHYSQQKRQCDFLRAAKLVLRQVPSARFFLIGRSYPNPTSRAYGAFLKTLAKDLGISHQVSFLEEYRKLFALMNTMDVIALPSIGEGTGTALLEAMALAKPVIGTKSGGIAEMIGNAGILVPPKDPRGLAEAMLQLLSNSGKARRLGERGRARVQKKFDSRKIARQYEMLYEKIVKDAR